MNSTTEDSNTRDARPGACELAYVVNVKLTGHMEDCVEHRKEVKTGIERLYKKISEVNDKFEGRWWTIMRSIIGTLIIVVLALLGYIYTYGIRMGFHG